MADTPRKSGSDLFIVDNSDTDWKVVRYLHQWAEIAHTIDIATSYFEIGATGQILGFTGVPAATEWLLVEEVETLLGRDRTPTLLQSRLATSYVRWWLILTTWLSRSTTWPGGVARRCRRPTAQYAPRPG